MPNTTNRASLAPRSSSSSSSNVFHRVLKLWVSGAALSAVGGTFGRPADSWAPAPAWQGEHTLPTLPGGSSGLVAPAPQPSAGRLLVNGVPPMGAAVSDTSTRSFEPADAEAGCGPAPDLSPCLMIAPRPVPAPERAVKSIMGRQAWRLCEVTLCGNFTGNYDPSADVRLVFSFETSAVLRAKNMTSFDAPRRDRVRAALRDVEQYINLRFVEGGDGPAHIVYGQPPGDTLTPAGSAGEVLGYTQQLGPNQTAIQLPSRDALDMITVAHETLHALGFVHPFSGEGMDGTKLAALPTPGDAPTWLGDKAATILSYTDPPAWQGMEGPANSRYAPLDLSALAYRYGTAPRLAGDTVHVFDADFGAGSVHDDLGHNTLQAAGDAPAYLTLRTDGSTSLLNNTQVLRLSATSVFTRGDISETGGTLQGNDLSNHLVGSPGDDVFETGAGNASITTGGGADVIIVSKDAQHVRIHDLDTRAAQLAFEGSPAVTLTPQANDGLLLRADTGAQVHLQNGTGFDPRRGVVTRQPLPRGQLRPALPPASSAPAGGQAPDDGTSAAP